MISAFLVSDVTGKAKGLWAKNKYYIIAGLVGVLIIFIMCCCCVCRRKLKKKKKKDHEKVKLKGAKPGKKLQRIQPGKIEKKAMVFLFAFESYQYHARQTFISVIGGFNQAC